LVSGLILGFQFLTKDNSNTTTANEKTPLSTNKSTSVSKLASNSSQTQQKKEHKKTPELPSVRTEIQAEQQNVSLSPIDRIKAIQEKTALHQALIQDHENFKRYPEYNQKITSIERDPTEKRYEIDERTTDSEEGDSSLTIWSDKKYYLHGDQATIYATLEDAHGLKVPTKFIGQIIFSETKSLQHIEFLDLDQDGVYEYHLTLDQINDKILTAGLYKILIVNNTNELADAVTFTLSEPELQLTGNYKEAITAKGSLLIEAEVEVSTKNRFYFQASLYSSTNDPIGSTQHSTELPPGKHWIPLDFDGLMIRDTGEPGPFLLKSLSLAKVALPIQRAPIAYPGFYTKDYDVDQFRSTNYAATDAL